MAAACWLTKAAAAGSGSLVHNAVGSHLCEESCSQPVVDKPRNIMQQTSYRCDLKPTPSTNRRRLKSRNLQMQRASTQPRNPFRPTTRCQLYEGREVPQRMWRTRVKAEKQAEQQQPQQPKQQQQQEEGEEGKGEFSPGWGSPVWQPGADYDSSGEMWSNGGIVRGRRQSTLPFNVTKEGKAFRPHRIILVRHGQSEGNVDESAYTRIPDNKIALTQKGWEQATRCGRRIRRLIEADGEEDWKVYFYVSPYTRTIQTLRGIGLAFERHRIAGVREEPRIREQDFGNFQDRERMRVQKDVRLRYGRFFYRFPDGESAADVYDRVTGFRETIRADIDIGRFQREDAQSQNMNLVLVSHGLTLRVFLMRWYKWTVEQFEGLYNFGNTGMMVMQLGSGGRYSLCVHHSREELKEFGMTDEMIDDQEWQLTAKPGELHPQWVTSGPTFFDHFDYMKDGVCEGYECEGLSHLSESHKLEW